MTIPVRWMPIREFPLDDPRTWDVLAEAAKWSRSNSDVLVDTHWVGGDPGLGQVYGWASWSKRKAILALRNPSDQPAEITLRLEAGMPLYGNELDRGTTPFEAGLGRVVRLAKEGGFVGRDALARVAAVMRSLKTFRMFITVSPDQGSIGAGRKGQVNAPGRLGGAEVHTVEHLLSACHGLGVDEEFERAGVAVVHGFGQANSVRRDARTQLPRQGGAGGDFDQLLVLLHSPALRSNGEKVKHGKNKYQYDDQIGGVRPSLSRCSRRNTATNK